MLPSFPAPRLGSNHVGSRSWPGALLLAGLVLLATSAFGSCNRRGSQPPPFDCEALQKRAERCEAEILDIVRQRYHVEKVTAGTSPQEADQAFLRFKVRFQKRLRDRVPERECRGLGNPRDAKQRKRASALRYCFSRPGCRAFGECILSQ